jgi:hypothetical protein
MGQLEAARAIQQAVRVVRRQPANQRRKYPHAPMIHGAGPRGPAAELAGQEGRV